MSDFNHSTSQGSVVTLHQTMSDAIYDAERARLRELYGDTSTEANAKSDQALAALFHRSGWTQEKLAEKEGKDRSYIARRLLFGRFLSFVPVGANSESLPKNLTERRFRSFWDRTPTGDDERVRFRAIAKLMQDEIAVVAPRRPKIGQAIKDRYADGKWHKLKVITNKIEGEEDHVRVTLDAMIKNKTYGVKCEKKKVGTEFEYRLFRIERNISSSELIEKLTPIVKGMEDQGRKNMATMSVTAVAVLAAQLRKLLAEWAE